MSFGRFEGVDLLVVPLLGHAEDDNDANALIVIWSASIVVCSVSISLLAGSVKFCFIPPSCINELVACAEVVIAAAVGDAIGVVVSSVSVSGEADKLLSLLLVVEAVSLRGSLSYLCLSMASAGSPQ